MKKNIFGILLTAIIALLAIYTSNLPFKPFTTNLGNHLITPEIIAIIFGLFINNIFKISEKFRSGIKFTIKDLLAIAIILMGAKLNLTYIAKASNLILLVNIISILLNVALGLWICRKFRIEKNLTTLMVVGNSICGSSAILVMAPLIKASQNNISLSLIISSILGLLAIFIYPAIGQILGMNTEIFGIWTGATVQSVAQVVATGFAYDANSGEIAIVVKLIKVLLLAPTIFILLFLQRDKTNIGNEKIINSWKQYTPPFIIGFIMMIIINSLGGFNFQIYDHKLANIFSDIAGFLVIMVMAGIGLETNFKSCANIVTKPLISSLLAACLVSMAVIILIAFLYNLT